MAHNFSRINFRARANLGQIPRSASLAARLLTKLRIGEAADFPTTPRSWQAV
jgi:hypothetical protein